MLTLLGGMLTCIISVIVGFAPYSYYPTPPYYPYAESVPPRSTPPFGVDFTEAPVSVPFSTRRRLEDETGTSPAPSIGPDGGTASDSPAGSPAPSLLTVSPSEVAPEAAPQTAPQISPPTPDDDEFPAPFPPPFGGFTQYPTYTPGGLLAPWTDPINQDMISDSVSITRDYLGGIFNAQVPDDQYYSYQAPTGTLWALLPENKTFEEVRCELRFCSWLECFAQYDVRTMINKSGVVYLTQADEYYNIMFTNWTKNRADEYSFRSGTREQQGSNATETMNRMRRLEKEAREKADEKRSGRRMQYYPPYPPYPPEECYLYNDPIYCEQKDDWDYDYGELGGGFQYIRDEFPIEYNNTIECPKCGQAKASPKELSGEVDQRFVEVSIEGATPDDVEIKILAVGQDSNPKCNAATFNTTDDAVRPNARGIGNSTAMVRRTVPLGTLNPMRYTIFFSATNEVGSCRGQVEVCSPPDGLTCDDYFYYYGYDATTTRYCTAN